MPEPLHVHVTEGPRAGESVQLEPEQAIRIGRSPQCEIAVPSDSYLSSQHCRFVRQTEGCLLTDLQSRNGTFVGAERISERVLAPGDTFAAGTSRFTLLPEERGAPEPGPEFDLTDRDRACIDLLRTAGTALHAVLDAARDEQIPALLARYPRQSMCLFDPPQSEELAAFAPYAVELEPEGRLLDEIVHFGWGQSWGVFLAANLDRKQLREHLRRCLLVETPAARKLLFRFYDPRVLRDWLPRFDPGQRAEFFGPVAAYFAEAQDPASMLRFTPQGRGAAQLGKASRFA